MSKAERVVIVGGGTGGITVAARLAKASAPLAITIIEPSDKHYYQPLWTLVGGGVVDKTVTEREEASVIPSGVTWLRDSVEEFHPDENQVSTSEHGRVDYDWLIVAAGIQVNWGQIKGLREALGKDGVCSNYSYEHADSTWRFLQAVDKGNAVFTYPSTPIKCGGAPQKIMWLADHHLRKRDARDKVNVVFASAGDKIFGVQKYRDSLERLVEERKIDCRWHYDLVEVRAAQKEAVFRHTVEDREEVISYEMLHAVPPMSPPDFIAASPLSDEKGWVEVDKHSLQHTRHPNVFALGDASSLPTSKTGAAVRKQAPVLVENLLAIREGKSPSASYDGYTSCPLVTGYGRLILAEFDYDGKPVETFPFDQSKERLSMYLLKKHILPPLYWQGMLRGRA
jgi:sulfide:quinone oxidoreductase